MDDKEQEVAVVTEIAGAESIDTIEYDAMTVKAKAKDENNQDK